MKQFLFILIILFFQERTQAQEKLIDTFGFEWTNNYGLDVSGDLFSIDDGQVSNTLDIDLLGIRELSSLNQIGTNTNQLTYSNTIIGTEMTQSLFVFNNGDESLEITQLELSNEAYVVTNPWLPVQTYTILPGDTIEFLVDFVPSEQSTYGGILTIHSNDPNNPEYEISLIGNGVFTTGLVSASVNVNLNAYPNPTRDVLSVEVEGETGSYELLLVNIEGKQIKMLHSNLVNQDFQSFVFDLSDLSKGVYQLILVGEEGLLKSLPIVKD